MWCVPDLEAEVHGCEGEVVPCSGTMLRQEVQVVLELEQCEVDESQQVRPNIHSLVGEDESTGSVSEQEFDKFYTFYWEL